MCVIKPPAHSSPVTPTGSVTGLASPKLSSERYLLPTANIYPSKATLGHRPSSDTQSQSDTNATVGSSASRTPSGTNGHTESGTSKCSGRSDDARSKSEKRASAPPTDDIDVQSIINERRPSKLKSVSSSMVASGVADQYGSTTPAGSYGRTYVTEERLDEALPASTSNVSDSMVSSASASASGSGSGGATGGRNGTAIVHMPDGVCATIATDVRIYVDDTDSTSSNGHRKRAQRDDTLDAPTTILTGTAVQDATEETEEAEQRSERFERPSSSGPLDPS